MDLTKKKVIDKVLVINNPDKEDVFGIIGRMEIILEYFKANPKHKNLVPFLETYYLITKAVAEKQLDHPGFFKNPSLLKKLDVHFAGLYFEPLKVYLETGKSARPWKCYFDYCERLDDGMPFLQMFLGINAHINGDLCTSLKSVRYKERGDYLAVNTILHEKIPEIMKFLAFVEHDYYVMAGYLYKKLIEEEFQKVVVGWRLNAWTNAEFKLSRKHVMKTERVGESLVKIFEKTSFLKNWRTMATDVNCLEVKL